MKQFIKIQSWRNIWQFISYIWGFNRNNLLVNIIIRLISIFVPIISLYVGKLIIDELVYSKNLNQILLYVSIEAIIVICSNILSRISSYINQSLNYNFELYTSKKIIEQFNRLSLQQIENAEIKSKFYLAKNESHDGSSLINELLGCIESVFSIISLSIVVIVYNPIAITFFIATAFVIFISETYFYSYIYKLQRKWIPERRKTDYYYDLLTTDQNYKEIKLLRSFSFFLDLFSKKKERFQTENLKLQKKRLVVNIFLYAINLVVYYYIYYMFINNVLVGLITIGTLTYISGILLTLRSTINSFFNRIAWLNDRASYLNDFFSFFSIIPSEKITIKKKESNITNDGLVFSHVGYKYENQNNWAVYDLCFQIKKGERVLIMGLNGSGKTTIIKLICKLYIPTEGEIYLNGKNIYNMENDYYFQQVGAIFQDFIKYEMTVAENISIGNLCHFNDLSKIEVCANMSRLSKLIDSLPDKYQQQLGKLFKNGIQLSGGEWQKIAIARLLYGNHSILLLDEPSSALDVLSERNLYQDLLSNQAQNGKTIIIVSHRISNLQKINHVIFLKKGIIIKNEILEKSINGDVLYDDIFNTYGEE